jgi:serine/threonine protein kinase/Flp pilus assembly protein TadD
LFFGAMTAKAKYPYQVGDEPVPGYRLVRLLGKGAFGEVWEAKAPGGTRVAVKVIPDLGNKLARKEFRALAIIKDIHHSNLVSINAFWLKDGDGNLLDDSLAAGDKVPGEFAGNDPLAATVSMSPQMMDPARCELIIAMSLGRKSLFNRLEECQAEGAAGIPAGELLNYIDDAARAIDYLNSDSREGGTTRAGVQHCDIKPHNILIVGTSAQVCDFGLARVQGQVRATASLSATVAYAAPECLEKPGDPSPTTDQYSLAITYYELKTGSLPYRNETLFQVMQASLAGQLDLSRVTPAEEAVLRRATARKPSERFPSAAAMVKALRGAVEGTAGIESPLPARPNRSRRDLVLPALALVLAIGFCARWLYIHQNTVTEQGDDVQHKIAEQKGDENRDFDPVKASAAKKNAVEQQETAKLIAEKGDADKNLAKLIHRGNELSLRKEYAAAIAEFDRAIELAPNSAAAFFGRGVAYGKTTALDLAISDFTRARELDDKKELALDRRPELAEAHLQRAQQRRQMGEFTGALQDCALVIEQFPDRAADAYAERGACARDQGRLSQAAADLSEAIRLAPGKPLAYSRRGYLYLKTNQFDAALADLNEAIRLEPNDLDYLNRGIVYSVTGKSAEALAELTALIQRDSSNRDAFYQRALVHRDCGKYKEAIADFRAALAIEPNDADSLALLATLLACGPEATELTAIEAATLARKACTLSDGKESRHLDALAATLAKNGDFPKAVQTAVQAVRLAEGSPEEPAYRARLELYKAAKPFLLPPIPSPR